MAKAPMATGLGLECAMISATPALPGPAINARSFTFVRASVRDKTRPSFTATTTSSRRTSTVPLNLPRMRKVPDSELIVNARAATFETGSGLVAQPAAQNKATQSRWFFDMDQSALNAGVNGLIPSASCTSAG